MDFDNINWKKAIAILTIVSSIIAIFSFTTGRSSISQVLKNPAATSETKLIRYNGPKNSQPDGIYIKESFLRKCPDFFEAILGFVCMITGGDTDEIYIINNQVKTTFMKIRAEDTFFTGSSGEKFLYQISISPSGKRFLVNLHHSLEISNLDGSHRSSFRVNGGTLENAAFTRDNIVRTNLIVDENSYNEKKLTIGGFQITKSAICDLQLDNLNIITKMSGI